MCISAFTSSSHYLGFLNWKDGNVHVVASGKDKCACVFSLRLPFIRGGDRQDSSVLINTTLCDPCRLSNSLLPTGLSVFVSLTLCFCSSRVGVHSGRGGMPA